MKKIHYCYSRWLDWYINIFFFSYFNSSKFFLSEKKVLPISEVYPNPVGEYTIRVNTDDLFDAKKRLLDPLSYASFLELIQESSTLPGEEKKKRKN